MAESIEQRVSGDTTAWLLGGDVAVIDVAGSPSYRLPKADLEALATAIAQQAIEYAQAPLESIVITFHEGQVSDQPDALREFVFLVSNDRPVLQPNLPRDATGPLTDREIEAAVVLVEQSYANSRQPLTPSRRECVLAELKRRARDAGDTETLDAATIEFLTPATWSLLDASARRIFLAQAIASEALFACARQGEDEMPVGK